MTKKEKIKAHDEEIETWLDRIKNIENDTVLTRHGMMTHDERYKGETGEIVGMIQSDNNLSNDQAYYFLYFMTSNNLTYEETKEQLLSNKDFEEYDKRKRARRNEI